MGEMNGKTLQPMLLKKGAHWSNDPINA